MSVRVRHTQVRSLLYTDGPSPAEGPRDTSSLGVYARGVLRPTGLTDGGCAPHVSNRVCRCLMPHSDVTTVSKYSNYNQFIIITIVNNYLIIIIINNNDRINVSA